MNKIHRTDRDDIKNALQVFYGDKGPDAVMTGLTDLDCFLGGFRRGDLIVIGGRPGMGKGSFALSLVKNIAIGDKVPVLYLSWYSDKEHVLTQLLCMLTGMYGGPPKMIKDADRRRLEEASEKVLNGNLYIADLRDMSPEDLEQSLYKMEESPKLIIVEDLQTAAYGDDKDDKKGRAKEYLSELKQIGQKFGCAVLVLSQLSRKPEIRKDHRPLLNDFREHEAIKAAADVVLCLYRESYYDKDTDFEEAEVIIMWNRRGPAGTVALTYSDGAFKDHEVKDHEFDETDSHNDGLEDEELPFR